MIERKDSRIDPALGGPENDFGLETYFAAARAEKPQPSGDFLARMEAMALEQQPVARPEREIAPEPTVSTGLIRQLRDALGGWAGMAGLATACAAGLWIGISPPEGLSDYWNGSTAGLGTLGVDPLGGFELALMEG
ncbi:hypothetical protein [Antarctobacter jejuensis]|uniref:hypothetical protein n=1 Tax=Antarctobacter jejuensis TaxID=1439938 RepID=UPI003FD5A915